MGYANLTNILGADVAVAGAGGLYEPKHFSDVGAQWIVDFFIVRIAGLGGIRGGSASMKGERLC